MDLIMIAIWGITGAVAALIAYLLVGKNQSSRTKYILCFLVVLFALNAAVRVTILPSIQHALHAREADKALSSYPAYRRLAKHEPQLYHRVRATLIEGLDKGEPAPEMTAKMIAPLSVILPKYISHASDRSVVHFATTVKDGVTALGEKNPDACYQFLYPQAFRAKNDPSSYLTEASRQEYLNVLNEILESATSVPQPLPDAGRAAPLLHGLQVGLAETFGDDLRLLARTATTTDERQKVCEMTGAMFSRILKLPEEDSSILLRHLLARKS